MGSFAVGAKPIGSFGTVGCNGQVGGGLKKLGNKF